MALRIESQAEPIPGYRLIERLGGGGFGEVWKCEAPGGLFKAIKFVYGDLEASTEESARAEQELKALSRVKTVHHPYILSLERFDIIDGRLLIVMELADRTLWDRFKEARTQGLPGIPREELLGYMQETAEALDLMNEQYKLQHLDIKPQNLFLIFNHIKVADFGLVKDLQGMAAASVTGGVTPVYAAPETFDNWVSRFSDQYSLAIVYQELLTGQRPFSGSTVRQLVLQHLQGEPDLTSLPGYDRAAVGRALAKNPDERFPNCVELIKALRVAPSAAAAPPAAPETPKVSGEASLTQQAADTPADEGSPSLAMHVTKPVGRRHIPTQPHEQRRTAPEAPRDGAWPEFPRSQLAGAAPEAPRDEAISSPRTEGSTTLRSRRRKSVPLAPEKDGVLLPSLVIGLGTLGQVALKQLRREILDQFGSVDALPQLRLLCLDADPDATQTATQGGEHALRHGEVLVARLQRPSYYIKSAAGQSGLQDWLPAKMVYAIPRQQVPAGVRALGRLAVVTNHGTIARRLEAELQARLRVPEALQRATEVTGLPVASAPRVYIVTSLAGGTGSGMFIDLAYIVKGLLKKLGHPNPDVVGLFLLPQGERHPARAQAQANAYAALAELKHFASPSTRFAARYGTGEPQFATKLFTESGPLFRRCVVVPAPAPTGWAPSPDQEVPTAVAAAGFFLFADLCTPLGHCADRARRQLAASSGMGQNGRGDRLLYQTFGTYRILWPQRHLLAQAGRLLCRRLIQRWTTKDAKPLREGIKQWVGEQWDGLKLSPDNLITRLREACEQRLQQTPEKVFEGLLGPITTQAGAGSGKQSGGGRAAVQTAPSLASVIEALEQVDQLLGFPEECQTVAGRAAAEPAPAGPILEALKEVAAALAAECELKMAQMSVRLIEQPEFRLAGAEETIRQFTATVEQALQHQEDLAKELQERSVSMYNRLRELLEKPVASQPASGSWKTPFARKSTSSAPVLAPELVDLLRYYPKCRYQSLILQHISSFYVGLRGQLSDQLREVDFCRQRLGELSEMMSDARASKPGSGLVHTTRGVPGNVDDCLFPEGNRNLDEAVKQLDKSVLPEDLQALDQRIQDLIRRQFRAMVHVCMTSANLLRAVAPAMQQEAEAFLFERVGEADVVEMYLARHAEEEALKAKLTDVFEEAAPELARPSAEDETCVLALPPGPSEQRFRQLAQQALPEAKLQSAAAEDEIVLYREQIHISLTGLKQFSVLAEAYRQLSEKDSVTPHSRVDITDW